MPHNLMPLLSLRARPWLHLTSVVRYLTSHLSKMLKRL